MRHFQRVMVLSAIVLLFASCHPSSPDTLQKSFCYWKTNFDIDSADAANLKNLSIQHFYLRFFDVDWDAVTASPMPVASCEFAYRFGYQTDITPTVYITNAVFENIKDSKIEEFAWHLINKISKMQNDLYEKCLLSIITQDSTYKRLDEENSSNWSVKNAYCDSMMQQLRPAFFKRNNEILIDCDWTQRSMKKYFRFLNFLKSKMPEWEITSTLRLWQYRDFHLAGIPPVKRCLLMCYNLSDPRKYETVNSIATIEEFEKYFTKSSYPLKLDIALPLHSWAIYFRGNKFKGIVNGINEEEISRDTSLFGRISEYRYRILKDTVIQEVYYRYGDEFRVEQVSFNTLLAFAKLINKHISIKEGTRISFFSWDAIFYNRLSKDEYNQIYSALSN